MGFLRHRDEPAGERFLMREKLLSIGDDFWIENEQGERAYKVNGKALRFRQTFVLEDPSGGEIARIQERKLTVRDKIAIERGGDTAATVHKALIGIRDRFAIDVERGADMKAHGNVVDHEYEIERDGETVAQDLQEVVSRAGVLRRRHRARRGRAADPRDHRRHRLAHQPGLTGRHREVTRRSRARRAGRRAGGARSRPAAGPARTVGLPAAAGVADGRRDRRA